MQNQMNNIRPYCIICGGQKSKRVFNEFGVDILKCEGCGHVYSSYQADQHYDGYFDQQALEGQDQFWWDEAHRGMYHDFCRRFIANEAGKLLDVGCGLGFFVKYMQGYPDWDAWGSEISGKAVDYATHKLGLTNVCAGKLEEAGFQPNSFDIVTLWDVIEHIPDPDQLIKAIIPLLKPGGILFLHTPNVNVQLPKARLKKLLKGMNPGVHYLEAKDHVNIYSAKTISCVLTRNGLEVSEFVHLRPVHSVSGSKSVVMSAIKYLWAFLAAIIYAISFKQIHIGNLFIVARKRVDIEY